MKKIISLFCAVLIAFSTVTTVFSVGDGNLDGGGGGLGGGSNSNFWNPGDEGVRVTVVRVSDRMPVTVPVDFTNQHPDNIQAHFGKVSKISYVNVQSLLPSGQTYSYNNPVTHIPKIISSASGSASIEVIKQYFCSEYTVLLIAELVGMDYNTLIGGQYKLLIEPIAYLTYNGVLFAMTATEAALYDQKVSGDLRAKMVSVSHKNLPLAMFLETSDLGYPAWSGSKTTAASNDNIISSLGLGIVRFTGEPDPPPQVNTFDYEYRVNTEVITAVTVRGGQSDPDNPKKVTFKINGTTYNVGNVYYPSGDSQLAWVRWTTPSTPQDMVINVTVTGGGSAQGTINVRIISLDENPPPNPVADDRNNSFARAAVPSKLQKTTQSWGVWRPYWYAYWVWHSYGGGYWCDHGWWAFEYDAYSASLTASMTIKPDDKSPTAYGKTMKSGYGININVQGNISTNQSTAVTGAQNAVTYFPEFKYETYWRLLDRMTSGYSAKFEFKTNKYSTYNRRTHFTPIWYPDGNYTAYTYLIDAWTPSGMLSINLNDTVTISGNLWDDWHIAPRIAK